MAGARREALAGEELAAVDRWLRERVPDLEGNPEVSTYTGGASNWTYRLHYPSHDLVLRRPPTGTKAKSAHDMGREVRVQQALRASFPLVPRVVAFCDDPAILGVDFYVMERLEGTILRADAAGLGVEGNRLLSQSFVDTFAALHAVDPVAVGLDALGKGPGYARRQIDGWTDRYRRARTWNVPRFTKIMAWLDRNVPRDSAACVLHNDFRFDNLVYDRFDPPHVVGVLDWEMATVGDPLLDVGASLAYWIEGKDDSFGRRTRLQPTHLPGMFTRAEVKAAYAKASGRVVADWTFYEVYGLFRLAGILQQIYYRYHHGQTRNPKFRRFWLVAHYMHWRCKKLIRQSRRESRR
jgi:aminoglycoside phosphotransferase (APT) family kinase protein